MALPNDERASYASARFSLRKSERCSDVLWGKDILKKLLRLHQGKDSTMDYAIKLWILATQSLWNKMALSAIFWEGLRSSDLQSEMACKEDNLTLS